MVWNFADESSGQDLTLIGSAIRNGRNHASNVMNNELFLNPAQQNYVKVSTLLLIFSFWKRSRQRSLFTTQ